MRFKSNCTPDSSFGDNGRKNTPISGQTDVINEISILNNKLYAVGYGQFPGNLGTVIKYFLNETKAPTVKITSPVDGAKYTANATIILSAEASDEDGTVKTVSFYNGDKLIFTELAP